VVDIWIDLIAHHRSLDPDYASLPSLRETLLAETWRGLRSEHCRIVLAEPARGFAFAEIDARPSAAPAGSIHELWVEPGSRRRGLGRALVAAAEAFFDERGGARVSVRVEVRNPEGLRFWRALGFDERARILERGAP
jgi:ribosomal protein S18 acetylase RimI-like enzyme